MPHPPMLPQWWNAPHRVLALGDLELDSGEVMKDAFISFVTHGRPNPAGSNAVLLFTSIGTSHHRMDFLIGRGRAFDPERHFVVCVDALGNGLSSSPSNSRSQRGIDFPRFTIGDMTRTHCALMRHLELDRLHAMCGASMGAMQALQTAEHLRGRVDRLVLLTPLSRATTWTKVVNELARQALFSDPAWNGREFISVPRKGWINWAGAIRVIASFTPATVEELAEPSAEVLLQRLANGAIHSGMDPLDWIYQSWAYDGFDVRRALEDGTLARRTLLFAPPLDLYNPTFEAQWLARRLSNAELLELPTRDGHRSASEADSQCATFINDVLRADEASSA
ncbi:MAG: alpha/beta fold hydrolase [Lautropia sp.]